MRTLLVGKLLFISMLSLGLTACGADKIGPLPVSPAVPTPVQTPPTTLTGNWLLTGSRVPAVYPTVSSSLFIQGDVVTGSLAFEAQCNNAGFISLGVGSSGAAINGAIAADGTFQASTGTLGPPTVGTTSVSLTGNSPLPATPSVWTGTYSVVFTPGLNTNTCAISQTGTFAATPIAPLTGTYLGVPAFPSLGGPFGTGALLSVEITQGTPTFFVFGNVKQYLIPLTANLTITNSACPFSGSSVGPPQPSSISGDTFTLFLTAGFPFGVLSGTLDDATANSFFADLTSLAQVNGCPGIAFYHFTRK